MTPEPATRAARFPALDGLRGLAILSVFLYHYAGGARSSNRIVRLLGEADKAGWAGVPLFFVLSGFLITGILWTAFDDPHWARKFYMRRILRIFPLYYASLLLVVIAAACVGTLPATLRSLWIPALFLQNFPGLSEHVQSLPVPILLHHFWSLAVEEQFYLLWPWLLSMQKTRQSAARLCLLTFALSLAFRVILCITNVASADWICMLPAHAGELAAGAWLAVTYGTDSWHTVRRWALPVAALSLAAFVFTSWRQGGAELTGSWQIVGGLTALTLGLAALLAHALEPGIWQPALEATWLRWLGKISYGVYVFHILLRPQYWRITHLLAGPATGAKYFLVRLVVAAVCTLSISWLSYKFFESRFLRLKSRFAFHSR